MKPRSLALLLGGLLLFPPWARGEPPLPLQLPLPSLCAFGIEEGGANMDWWTVTIVSRSQLECDAAFVQLGKHGDGVHEHNCVPIYCPPGMALTTTRSTPRPDLTRPNQIIIGPDGEPSFVYDLDHQPAPAPGR